MSLPRFNGAAVRRLVHLAFVLLVLIAPAQARSQPEGSGPATPAAPAAAPAPAASAPRPAAGDSAGAAFPPASWAAQIETLARWVDQRSGEDRCTERCYILDRLRITGVVGEGPLGFELSGAVLADGPVAVPLFGPPAHVRIEATLAASGAAAPGAHVARGVEQAPIGFEDDHYFLWTAARRFTLRGTLSLEGDLALTIPGPLNTLEANVTGGTVVEGARLSGLTGATIHFSRDGGAGQSAGPTVFQLSRAVRVGREIGFEYRLVIRSGTELGVVRLPLAFEEKVLDVAGATGWRVEGSDLVLSTAGRSADMKVTGTLAKVGTFSPDPRSAYEWWLLESDPEHRVMVKGDARQVDSAESPIARTQATSRLLLVQKGQQIEVTLQPLSSVEVLAAVVREHRRTLVLTERGDLVADDALTYENNGIDYLLYTPGGRPIYLATDAKPERIMHQDKAVEEVLVPLQTGSHSVRLQSLAQAGVHALGGSVELPMPSYPLTASQVGLTVGLPERVVPLALLGGDRPAWFADGNDVFAVVLGFAVGALAVRRSVARSRGRLRALRVLGGLTLAGLWFLSPPVFVTVLVALATAGAAWLVTRLFHGARRAAALVALLAVAGCVGLVLLAMVSITRSPSRSQRVYAPSSDLAAPSSVTRGGGDKDAEKTGNYLAQVATGGVLEGVTPVALSMPSYARSLYVSRELVTRERAFRPVLVYATEWALGPLALLWLMAVAVVLAEHRAQLTAVYRRAAEWLMRKPDEQGNASRSSGEGT